MPVINENGRTLAGVMTELKDELKEFVATRIDMAKSELRDKMTAWKASLPLIVIGLVLLGTAWFVLTAALISIVAMAFRAHPFAYFFAFVIVGVAYAFAGVVCAAFAWRELAEQGIVPHRTMKVLQDDKVWLQAETRRVA